MCAFHGYRFASTSLCLTNSLQVQFFGHLTAAHVVSPQSMLTLLQSLIAVLEEFGVSHARAQNAALSAAQGLLPVGELQALKDLVLIVPNSSVWSNPQVDGIS